MADQSNDPQRDEASDKYGGTLRPPAQEGGVQQGETPAEPPLKTVASLEDTNIVHTLDPRNLPQGDRERLETLVVPALSRPDEPPPPEQVPDPSAQTERPDQTVVWEGGGATEADKPSGTSVIESPSDTPVLNHEAALREGEASRTWGHLVIRPRNLTRTTGEAEQKGSDYELLSVLGRGAMGVVFAARQASINRSVAVKMLAPKLAGDKRQRDQFLGEAVVTGELDHPNIVPIYDLAKNQEGALFYSMKHVRGTPWSQVLAEKSQFENLDIWMRTADAVAFGHSRGVIHRDLKPDNVMLGDFGEVLLMDWGIAVSRDMLDDPKLSESSGLAGTPAYMAPEMAVEGPLRRIRETADVYLLGAILYEIVTGNPPHHGNNVWLCLQAAAKNKIVPTDKTGELLKIAMAAMATAPSDRLPSVQSLQDAVREHLSHTESNALAARGEEDLRQAEQSGDYTDYQQAILAFREALELWKNNSRAQAGLEEASIACAKRALHTGDYDLGLSVLDHKNPQHAGLVRKLRARRRRRQGVRSLITMLVAIIAVGSVVSALWIEGSRRAAVSAREDAEYQRQVAVDNEGKAREEEKRAREEKEKADVAKDAALKAQAETEEQRKKADVAKDAALKAQAETEEQRKLAVANEKKATANEKKAVAASYRAQIALAASQIDANVFNRAKAELDDIAAKAKDSPLLDPPPWEYLRLRYMLQLSQQTIDVGSPVNSAAFASDGASFAAGGESNRVGIWRMGEDQPHRTIQTEWPQVSAVSFLADSRLITVSNGRLDGDGGQSAFPTDITVWDVNDGGNVENFGLANEQWVTGISIDQSAEGFRFVGGSFNRRNQLSSQILAGGGVRIWETGKEDPETLIGHKDIVWDVAISPDGDTIVSVDNFGHAMIWRRDSAGAFQPLRTRDRGPFVPHGNKAIYAVEFSPDGRYVATAGGDNRVLVWSHDHLVDNRSENADLVPEAVLVGHTAPVLCVGFSAKGDRLATSGDDATVRVWDWQTGEQVSLLRGHSNSVRSCIFCPTDDNLVLTGGLDGEARIWNLADYSEKLVLDSGPSQGILGATFSADGTRLVTAHIRDTRFGAAKVWELKIEDSRLKLALGSPILLEEGHTLPVAHGVVSRYERTDNLLTIDVGGNVRVWDLDPARQICGLAGQSQGLSHRRSLLATSEDGQWILVGGAGRSGGFGARLWNRSQFIPGSEPAAHQTLGGHVNFVTAVAVSPSGRFLFTGDQSGGGILWEADPGGGRFVQAWRTPPSGIRISMAEFLPGDTRLLCASAYQIRQFNVETGQEYEDGRLNHGGPGVRIVSMVTSKDGKRLLVGCSQGEAGRVTLWDTTTPDGKNGKLDERSYSNRGLSAAAMSANGQSALDITSTSGSAHSVVRLLDLTGEGKIVENRILDQQESGVNSATFLTDDATRIVTMSGNRAKSWDITVDPPAQLKEFGPSGIANCGEFSSDGALVVTAHADGIAKVWDVTKRQMKCRLSGRHKGSVKYAVFSPDDTQVFTAGSDGTVNVWDASTGEFKDEFCQQRAGKAVNCLAFSADGEWIVIASDEGTAELWEAKTGNLKRTLEGHSGPVACARFSVDGRWIITGSADQSARIWDTATGLIAAELKGHSKSVAAVAFSPDGRRVLTGSADETAKLWAIHYVREENGEATGIESVDEVLSLRGHRGEVTSVAFSPDGRNVLTAGRDGQAVVWPSANPE
ncbi:MAG: protein kinase [Planctomycetes bacterium]|nr:protein kinase [Planctomycetota bacterium]